MFGPLADVPHLWIALGVTSVVFLGAALSVPSAPPPDAAAVADTVDAVAAAPHPTTASHPVTATAVRIGPGRVSLRADGGTASATFAYGPVTPVRDGRLARVLHGAAPGNVFSSRAAFRRALGRARTASPGWQRVDDRVFVRSVEWEGIDATLAGA